MPHDDAPMTHDRPALGQSREAKPARTEAVLLAHALWARGETSTEVFAAAARSVGVSLAEFEAIREFHRKAATRPKDEPLVFCRGVSCRMHGAEDLHASLRPLFESAGILGTTVDVLCLSQCEHGPNLKLGDQVLCTGRGCVITDSRPWRSVNTTPKPVEVSDRRI
jgi:NADH:ubiquinone oxidoreductase subunit E